MSSIESNHYLNKKQQIQNDSCNKLLNNNFDTQNINNYCINKNNYGILSWQYSVNNIKLECIEYITNNYEKLIIYIRNKLKDIYMSNTIKSPFIYKNILVFKVDEINNNLLNYDFITNNYEYIAFKIDERLLFFILLKRNGQLYTSIINSLPELYKLHNVSYHLQTILKLTFKKSILKFIIKNKLNLNIETCKTLSKNELYNVLKNYYYNQVWEKYVLL